MTDPVRVRIMRANRAKDTGPELRLRRALHARGLRYRLNVTSLPGSPDIVFPKFEAVIFVHGCYWHHHTGCKRATIPKKNRDFWVEKFEANRRRDEKNVNALLELGWRVGIMWECGLTSGIDEHVEAFLRGTRPRFAEWTWASMIDG